MLAEAHEDQATDAERRGDVEQAMGWFADSMRLRDVIHVVVVDRDSAARHGRARDRRRPPGGLGCWGTALGLSLHRGWARPLWRCSAMMGIDEPWGVRCRKSPANALIASVSIGNTTD